MSFFSRKREKSQLDAKRLEGVGTNEINRDGYCPLVCKIPVGLCENEIYNLDFSSERDACASYMITGNRDSIKGLLDAIIINGSLKYTPGEVSFRLYDTESYGMLDPYENARLPHITRIGSRIGENEAVHELFRLADVIKKRGELFKSLGEKCGVEINNICEYNSYAKTQEKGTFKHKKRIIAVLNGIRKILNSPQADERYVKQVCYLVENIAKRGSALGVHLILTSTAFSNSEIDKLLQSTFVQRAQGRVVLAQEKSEAKRLDFGKAFAKRIKEITRLGKGQGLVTVDGKRVSLVDIATLTPLEEYIEMVSDSVFFYEEKTEKLSKK